MTATATDYDEIVRVVQLYIDGFNDCDIDKFKEAFHENAWILFTDADGAVHKDLLANVFERWAAPPKANIVGRFISVIQAGDVAGVLLGFDDAADTSDSSRKHIGSWVDFHSLLRIEGVWKIMNKTATHSSRAGWAGTQQSQRLEAPPTGRSSVGNSFSVSSTVPG
jgi:Putative lumazine-binding